MEFGSFMVSLVIFLHIGVCMMYCECEVTCCVEEKIDE